MQAPSYFGDHPRNRTFNIFQLQAREIGGSALDMEKYNQEEIIRNKNSIGAQWQIDDYEMMDVTGKGGDLAGNESAQRL